MKFRFPTLDDKEIIEAYVREHYENNEKELHGIIGFTSMEYSQWVKKIELNTKIPDKDWGKSLTYLVFNSEDKLIGFLSIRYDLSEKMRNIFGDIGYGVRPTERKKGYATQMLKYSLDVCRTYNMANVIIGCYKENIASAKTIIKNGGKLIREAEVEGVLCQYYEIKL